jgi:hypothetical protein
MQSVHLAAVIFKLEELVTVRLSIVPCRVRKPFYRIFLRICSRNVVTKK